MNFNSVQEVKDSSFTSILFDMSENDEGYPHDVMPYIREIRNGLLEDCDKYMIADFPITEEKKEEWRVYRQELREITNNIENSGFIVFIYGRRLSVYKEGFSWPTPPSD
jgi:hypothetical protein